MEDFRSTSTNSDSIAVQKEWDEISCPICLDHPHNAVLLICRSHEKGCRSFICDTSYRHSNCLDRFKKLRRPNLLNNPAPPTGRHHRRSDRSLASNSFLTNQMTRRNSVGNQNDRDRVEPESMAEDRNSQHESNIQESNILSCPLCRETVSSWMIVKEARQYLDLKPRSCSRELCTFAGNYRELRRHARTVHPATRPADVDPSRQRAWRRLESEREYGDILSAVRSAMPGAVVLGDYVIDQSSDRQRERGFGEDRQSWLNTLLLLRVFNSGFIGLLDEPRDSSRLWWRMNRRSYGRRTLWDRSLLDRRGGGDDDLNPDDDVMIPRRRRRFARPRRDEDQQ